MIYLLTSLGLTPGDSGRVHIYTQTVHRPTKWNGIRTYEHTYIESIYNNENA